MKLINALVLDRDDLIEAIKDKPFNEIEIIHFKFFKNGIILHEAMVVFVDENGNTKIIKNRLGKTIV